MAGRRASGAVWGALSGLFLGALETGCVYLPALARTDVLPVAGPPLAATALYVALGAAAGAVHRALGVAALLALAAGSADLDPLGFLAAPAAVALAWVAARRPPLAWAGALLAGVGALALPREAPPREGVPPRPDIALVVLDTVAARDTSLQGAPRDTTPTLVALASEGVHWSQALASAPWTVPSHASLFTGAPARSAGAHHEHPVLAGDLPTTAERLAGLGYRTGAFVANPWLARATGLTRGFAHQEGVWDLAPRRASFAAGRLAARLRPPPPGKGGPELVARALAWLERGGEQPSFVFLNLLEAHAPYHAVPDPGRFGAEDPVALGERVHEVQLYGADAVGFPRPGELERARALYAVAVRAADDLLAAFVAGLRERGRLDHTLLVATSDHGEAFGEHGFTGHVIGLYEESLHVPLVMRHPALAGGPRVVREPVALARVHDTLVGVAYGAPTPASLLAAPAADDGLVVSEQRRPVRTLARFRTFRERDLSALDERALRVRAGPLVLLRQTPANDGEPRFAFFDLERDPGERTNLWPDPRAAALLERLERFDRAPVRGGRDPFFDEEFRERLEALGYLTPGP